MAALALLVVGCSKQKTCRCSVRGESVVRIIKIEGSVELAPLLSLADGIVDIVETGTTLRENGLEVVEDVMPVSSRVIVNMASLKLRKQEIEQWISRMEAAREEQNG